MLTVLGIGPGAADLRLSGTQSYLQQADIVIGSKRQLTSLAVPDAKAMLLPRLSELRDYLNEHLDDEQVLLASGDPLLYGIGSWALKNVAPERVRIIPGISSIQYMFHQIGLAMNDCYLTSSHGRQPDFDFLLSHSKVGMVTDDQLGPYQIAREVQKRHQDRRIYVGECLSYPNEKIQAFRPEEVPKRKYDLNVVIITNA